MVAERLYAMMSNRPDEWLTVEEAAAYTRCSTSYIYKKKGEIPHKKNGRNLLFTKSGLSAWITQCNSN